MPHVKAVTPETGARVDSAGIPMDWYVTIAVGRRSEDLPMLCRTDSKVTVSPSTPSSKLFNLSLPSEPGCLYLVDNLMAGGKHAPGITEGLGSTNWIQKIATKRDRTPRLPSLNAVDPDATQGRDRASAFRLHVFLPSGFFSVPPPRSF